MSHLVSDLLSKTMESAVHSVSLNFKNSTFQNCHLPATFSGNRGRMDRQLQIPSRKIKQQPPPTEVRRARRSFSSSEIFQGVRNVMFIIDVHPDCRLVELYSRSKISRQIPPRLKQHSLNKQHKVP